MAAILRGTKAELAKLGRALRAGELVGVPTETVYGLAADALNARACRRIFRVKGRPSNDPLIVHVAGIREAEGLAKVGPAARKLMERFWPGPLTLVLPKTRAVPKVVTSGQDSVALRMPAHPLMLRLLKAAQRPLAAPSANPFGYVSPTTAEHVQAGLGAKIPFILDGGPAAIGVESTIVDLRDEERPALLRPGKIGSGEIERVLGRRLRSGKRRRSRAREMVAPGMLARHYSPRTRLILHPRITLAMVRRSPASEAWIFPRVLAGVKSRANVFPWSDRPHAASVARSLFALLRSLDGAGWTALHTQLLAGTDPLAVAINDRLRRAAAR